MIFVGDIEGRYLTFLALLKQMPEDDVWALGDFIDRGPRTKQVIEWLRTKGNAILGNHEHQMIDSFLLSQDPNYKPYYQKELWMEMRRRSGEIYIGNNWITNNGGQSTLNSYLPNGVNFDRLTHKIHEIIPQNHINWLKTLPLFLETDNLFVSHGILKKRARPEDASNLGIGFIEPFGNHEKEENSLLWNIHLPKPYKNKIQIFGHLSFKDVKYFTNANSSGMYKKPNTDEIFAIGIDTSKSDKLTALHWPSMTVYEQRYID